MKLKIRKLTDDAVVPTKAHDLDIGWDLTATSVKIVDEKDYGYWEYGTDLAVDIPAGYMGLIFPRSSVSKTGQWLANSVGLIDPGYHGELKQRFKGIPDTKVYTPGDRVAQLVVIKSEDLEFELVEDLGDSERGEKGFGSSG